MITRHIITESRAITAVFIVGLGAVAAAAIWLIYVICLAFVALLP